MAFEIILIDKKMFNLKKFNAMTTLVKSNENGRSGLFPEFPSLFDDFFTRDLLDLGARRAAGLPAVNVKETETSYNLEVNVPGMDKKDFKIEIKNHTLIITGQKEDKKEEKKEEGKYLRQEFGFQSFTRSFTLPEDSVDSDNIKANYKDGILYVTVPKKEKAKERAKQIEIG